MRTVRDILLTILVVAAGVGWFSLHGPTEVPKGRGSSGWAMPEEGQESEQAGPGDGTEAVTASGLEATGGADAGERTERELVREKISVTKEVERMDPFLTGCIVGAVTVLAGVLASPLAAWLWERIHKKNT